MSQQATGTVKNTSWEETAFAEVDDNRKLTEVKATFAYSGDITGESVLRYLMVYNADETCDYYGLERVTGQINGRQGSFTLEQRGRWAGGELTGDFNITAGSGDGDLSGLTGEGTYVWDMQAEQAEFSIDYEINEA